MNAIKNVLEHQNIWYLLCWLSNSPGQAPEAFYAKSIKELTTAVDWYERLLFAFFED